MIFEHLAGCFDKVVSEGGLGTHGDRTRLLARYLVESWILLGLSLSLYIYLPFLPFQRNEHTSYC